MDLQDFIVVGENFHCTRIVKRGGIRTTTLPGGGEAVAFQYGGEDRVLPVPSDWERVSPAFVEGKIPADQEPENIEHDPVDHARGRVQIARVAISRALEIADGPFPLDGHLHDQGRPVVELFSSLVDTVLELTEGHAQATGGVLGETLHIPKDRFDAVFAG